MKSIKTLFIVLASVTILGAQTPTTFVARNVGFEATRSLRELSDGNYIMSGGNTITCISPWGNMEWSVTLQLTDYVEMVEVLEVQSGLLCIAQVNSSLMNYGIIFEMNSAHVVIWQKMYEVGTGNTQFHCASMTSDSFILIGGVAGAPFVMKANRAGNLCWILNSSADVYDIKFVEECDDGNYMLGTFSASIIKMDTAGNVLWQHAYLSTSTYAGYYSGMAETSSGYVFAGSFYDMTPPGHVLRIIKTDSAGNMTAQFTEPTYIYGFTEIVDASSTSDNGIILALWYHYSNTMQPANNYSTGFLVKVDSVGTIGWARRYTNISSVNAACETSDNGFLAGIQEKFGDSTFSYLHKTDPDGNDNCSSIPKQYSPGGEIVVDTSWQHTFTSGFVTVSPAQMNVLPAAPGFEFVCYTGLNENKFRPEFSVNPNPAHETFTVAAGNETGDVSVAVTNLVGEVIFRKTVVLPLVLQPDGAWASGCYFVTVTSGSGTSTQKLIIE